MMLAEDRMIINIRTATARVQESGECQWLTTHCPLTPSEQRTLATLLPLPAECNSGEPAWIVLPLAGFTALLRCHRDGSEAHIVVYALAASDYRACHGDAPAIIKALESVPKGHPLDQIEISGLTRTAQVISAILAEGDAPTLLGAAQALVDGGKIHLQAEVPIPIERLTPLWNLLPSRQRATLKIATYLNSTRLLMDLAAGPSAPEHAWTWNKVGDYPEGDYEKSLHQAATLNDNDTIARLLGRGSRWDIIMLGLALLAVLAAGQIMLAATGWKPPPLVRPIIQEKAP